MFVCLHYGDYLLIIVGQRILAGSLVVLKIAKGMEREKDREPVSTLSGNELSNYFI